jgi:hypothetical protein
LLSELVGSKITLGVQDLLGLPAKYGIWWVKKLELDRPEVTVGLYGHVFSTQMHPVWDQKVVDKVAFIGRICSFLGSIFFVFWLG